MSSTQTTTNSQHLYHLTNTILNAHSLHFIPISLLFLPFTFAASVTFKFYFSSSHGTDPFNLFLIKTIIASSQNLIIVLFCCFVILPTIAGVALITFSTNQAIHHKPITFSSTLKSLLHSYIPLLNTVITGSIKLIIVFLVFTLSPIALTEVIKALWFHFDLLSFSIFVNVIVSYALAITILYFIVVWGSAAAITVLESKSGFETLQQSANQSTEFQRHSLSIVCITGFLVGTALACSTAPHNSAANWTWILHAGAIYLQSSLMILLYVVANTVLYVQCKVESDEEIAKTAVEGELSGEDVRLVVNDNGGDQVLHELAKEEGNGGFNYMLYLLTVVWAVLLFVQFYYQA